MKFSSAGSVGLKSHFSLVTFFQGYVRPGLEGSYSKDSVTDQRPSEEEASGLQNLREALVFRYPEISIPDKNHLYLQGVFNN